MRRRRQDLEPAQPAGNEPPGSMPVLQHAPGSRRRSPLDLGSRKLFVAVHGAGWAMLGMVHGLVSAEAAWWLVATGGAAALLWGLLCLSDPGFVARGEAAERAALALGDGQGHRRCDACVVVPPPRSHHCRRCARCVRALDHHCGWAGRCVGAGNHRLFVVFLAGETAHVLSVFRAALSAVGAGVQPLSLSGVVAAILLPVRRGQPMVWPAIILVLLSCVWTLLMVNYWLPQLVGISRGQTGWELRGLSSGSSVGLSVRGGADRGTVQNWVRFWTGARWSDEFGESAKPKAGE